MLYFAYGSNMLHERMIKRVPSAKVVAVGILLNHSLKFHKVSKDGSGKCDIVRCNDKEFDSVFGVVYKISRRDKLALDAVEGRHYGYEMKWETIITHSGEVYKAFTYYATRINPEFVPFHSYKNIVIAGAIQNNLPSSYVDRIKSVRSKADPVITTVEAAKRAVQKR